MAFSALKNWILENYNRTKGTEKSKEYYEAYTNEDGSSFEISVIYKSGPNEAIALGCYYMYPNGAGDITFLFLDDNLPNSSSYFASYSYYASRTANEPLFSGNLYICAPEYSGDMNLQFESITGCYSNSDLDFFSYSAKMGYFETLFLLGRLFAVSVQPYGTYSIADFGFTANAFIEPVY